MVNVVLDADFLSAFLKIDALDRVREYFRTDSLLVPSAVFREVAVTSLLPKLTSTSWLEVREVDASTLDAISGAAPEELGDLGSGEREAIALAHSLERAVLLMNDKKALRSARAAGIRTVNTPAFLLALPISGCRAGSHCVPHGGRPRRKGPLQVPRGCSPKAQRHRLSGG